MNRLTAPFQMAFPHPSQSSGISLLRMSLFSVFFHAGALAILVTWTGAATKYKPPVQVVYFELNDLKLPPTLPVTRREVPAAKPQKPEPAKTVKTTAPAPAVQRSAAPVAAATKPGPETAKTYSPEPAPSAAPRSAAVAITQRPAPVTAGAAPPRAAAPAQAAPAQVSSGRKVDRMSVRAGYLQHCRVLIERHKEYPMTARRGRTEGTVTVSGTLGREGSLRKCTVSRTSGSSLLDKAALRSVQSVAQFPPIPPELPDDELNFEVPVTFQLAAE